MMENNRFYNNRRNILKRIGKLVPVIIVLNLLLTGCRGGIDYMVEEYNSRFGIHDDRKLNFGEENFVASDMLEAEYTVTKSGLSIPAPKADGAQYEWFILKPNTNEQEYMTTSTHLILDFQDIKTLLTSGTHVIHLKVTFKDTVYEDKALLYIMNY